jgi:SAM-dependent methyltransferase
MAQDIGANRTYWRTFWSEYPKGIPEGDFFHQVCHTIGGKPYSKDQFDCLMSSIVARLEIAGGASLLDICCGNGLVTSKLANLVDQIVAIDFSQSLIEVANKYHSAPNIAYHCMDAFELQHIRRAELAGGETSMTAANDLAVRRALETAGVEFIDENGGGPGVRLRKPQRSKQSK